ncbi:probable serine/threonine-protein kinase At1g09600 [Solanum pennellii]|uniref:Probable serine/threonine-protein kinase At1g09600 n=1 Tax=Solanum pennellii TaxID=28526 RepID=A0ABM1FHN5_SOLPN|nr:probable serine/threonine-protein kinase At1g09600 [Solanum pennellii]XP_027768451.1 probable serine/threonine-protein kinase At1g09600 [Solanum pennellii]XP_027768452.1 probable serine/threonine-protein kinase At1g09600 [Solanum pennellii]
MGCICSKGSSEDENVFEQKEVKSSVHMVAPLHREEIKVELVNPKIEIIPKSKRTSESALISVLATKVEDDGKTRIIERPKEGHHKRRSTVDFGVQQSMSRVVSIPNAAKGELGAAGWPSWLTSVAADAIQGWLPRSADSFEKLNKIGQGTYSSVYKARDLQTNKIVAMKKVRFVNMDPESVRFMAREISILRKLDHPNVMKLEALVTSRISGSLYLVFEYMEHDLAGLAAAPRVKFTEAQIKCYMQQLLRGLEHCHSRGVLHRDIKGSNLLIDDNGVLKIGDFGLATTFEPNQTQPLTSRVVTLWYRAPELLLGATEYGMAIDMWSAGCILAELSAGKPIMPGRTEVEQMHKIFKLCGSPSEEYWKKSKLPHATSFKPQHPYNRCVTDTFKDFPPSALALVDILLSIEPERRGTASSALNSEFFSTKPLPCDPSSLPKYPPSKEYDAKMREEEARRRKAESVKGCGDESLSKSSRQSKGESTTESIAGQGQSNLSISVKYNPLEESGTGFPIEPPRVKNRNGFIHSTSVIHPNAAGYSRQVKEDSCTSQHGGEFLRQGSHTSRAVGDFSSVHSKRDDGSSYGDSTVYVPKKSRLLCSGPLVPPGGSMEDMLKEHERQIQEAVRKARLEKGRTKKNCYDYD